jgi:hypothetical protein
MDPNAIVNRVLRLARMDTSVFDEVRDDQQELIPALIVLAISAFLAGLGTALHWSIVPASFFEPDSNWVNNFLLGSIFFIALYIVAALVIYVVMAQMYKVSADVQSLIRTMGYASIPMAASVLMFIPVIWPLFAIAPVALLLVYMIYAVQSSTNAESTQVVVATTIGFAVMVLVLGLIALQHGSADAPIGAGLFGIFFDWS